MSSFEEGLEAFMGTGEDSYLAAVKEILDRENVKIVKEGRADPDYGIWEIYDEVMAPDFTLSAPDGCVIELDGRCAHGWTSPVRGAGMI